MTIIERAVVRKELEANRAAEDIVAVTAASLGIPFELVQEVADEKREGCRGCGECVCNRELAELA